MLTSIPADSDKNKTHKIQPLTPGTIKHVLSYPLYRQKYPNMQPHHRLTFDLSNKQDIGSSLLEIIMAKLYMSGIFGGVICYKSFKGCNDDA